MSPRRLAALALASLVTLAACGDDPVQPPRDVSVAILNAPDYMGVGDSVRLLVGVLDVRDPSWNGGVTWASRAPGVVAVDSAGSLRGVAPGEAWVVATAAGRARGGDSALVEITAESRSFLAAVARDSLTPGDTVTVRIVVHDLFGAPAPAGSVRFASSDTLVARVDSLTGLVRVVGDGDATVSARTGARTSSVLLRAWHLPTHLGGVRLEKVVIGWAFACGLDAAGGAYCWGQNTSGQLGRGTRSADGPLPPAPVQTAERFASIAASRRAACGVTTAGALVCWGSVLVGMRPTAESGVPTTVAMPAGMGPVTRVFGGMQPSMCAVDAAGAHACFGDNSQKQIGDGVEIVFVPRPVPDAPALFATFAIGEMHGCGTTPPGEVWCWGDDLGWRGAPLASTYVAPTRVDGIPPMQKVTANFLGTCGLDASGGVWCGGASGAGGRDMARVEGAPAFVRFESGMQNDCGLTAAGALWCRESRYPVMTPQIVGTLQFVPFSRRHAFTEFSVGHQGICGITTDGRTICRATWTGMH